MGKRTPAQKARRNAAKKKRKLIKGVNPSPTGPNKDEEKGGLHALRKRRQESRDRILFGPDSSDSDADSDDSAAEEEALDVQAILEPYSKDQLIGFLCDAALGDPALHALIREAADRDVSHRKVFVHGMPWDATEESLRQVFSFFGAIDACNVVVDKATGRGKGYGFVLFRTRSGAVQALKQPHKQIGNRVAHCQLASTGPTSGGGVPAVQQADTVGRKIYVSNVHAEANPEKLKAFFAKFGEIESGPTGFDLVTGKSRGYATFVYKTQEGARKALQEPYKMFEGHQLHCQWATEPSKVKELASAAAAGLVGAAPQPVLAAVAAAQNLSLYAQNPAYAALLGQNPLLAAAAGFNPAALNPSVLGPAVDGALAGYGGNSSVLGTYGTQATAGLQGLQYGYSSLGRPGASYEGMPSYLW
ncbi:hypothetical protein Taro_033494 [Colocasia esculenta]|uniref:RRM domain-containing protein n=1 Tax=Colocasia esculenta TaxID=4460 RepID=A0A843VVE9_COLES|nr:hypothetical protein [Colocasia esculenta]